jgi:hypothetical protein
MKRAGSGLTKKLSKLRTSLGRTNGDGTEEERGSREYEFTFG